MTGTVFDKIKSRVSSEKLPTVTPVFDGQDELGTDQVAPTVVQVAVEPQVIKANNPGVPTMGFTMQVLADEFSTVLEKAMHQAGITSIDTKVFGIFTDLGIKPKGFTLYKDEYIDREFYVLNGADRMTEIFKTLTKAISNSNSEVISFPYTIQKKLSLPVKFVSSKEDYDMKEIMVDTLYLTQKEIGKLNYKFIKEVQFIGKLPHDEDSVDLIGFKIDREEWKAAPYRV